MGKPAKEVQAPVTEVVAAPEKNKLEQIMEAKGYPTLKAIATVFDLQPVRLYSVAKQPKEGVVYDAKVYNWDAVMRFIERRLGVKDAPETLEAVVDRALEIDVELKANDGRRSTAGSTSKEKIEVDGKLIAPRKYKTFEMSEGQLFILKNDPEVYKAVYQTLSHTVLVPVSDKAGTIKGNDVKVISNTMLNMKGVGPSMLDKGVEERFANQAAIEAAKAEAPMENAQA
jgi:hypothetical protein